MELKKIKLPFKIKKPILALGSHTKNTVCFAEGSFAYLSRIHSDLSSAGDFLSFERDVRYFLKKRPRIIAYDLHPEYQSTSYLQKLNAKRYTPYAIQHHHAHIASCMTENNLNNQTVIGVAFDGTGLGPDNTLWGAEFLVCDYKKFIRRAHLKEIPLLGGQKAIDEPWRVAVMWLYLAYKDKFLSLKNNFIERIDKGRWLILKNMYNRGFNVPKASSMGRLFDAAASIILEKYHVKFEAELAIELERLATRYTSRATGYPFQIIKKKDKYILDPLPLFREIMKDLKVKTPKEKIAYRFHLTVAEMIKEACLKLRKESRINKIVFSGGVFQNKLLLGLSSDLLYKENFKIYTHKKLLPNDSAVSLGQAVIANSGS